MTNEAINRRLNKCTNVINAKLDEYRWKCDSVSINITDWNSHIELGVYRDDECGHLTETAVISFNLFEGSRDGEAWPHSREEIHL